MLIKTALLSTALVLSVIATASAATNWLDTANSVLNSPTAQTLIQGKTATITGTTSNLQTSQISDGLKQALQIGTKNVVAQLGKTGGFNLDPKIHIPLPTPLAKADKLLSKMGMGSMTADLDTRMNSAAEMATPKAEALFVSAIQKMTITDARAILSGPKDSATQYLRKTMGPDLSKELQPVVAKSLSDAGAVKAYDAVIGQYSQMPLVASAKTNLNDYVVSKAMDGIFYYVGNEEAAIRTDPAKQTTNLLKAVFGGK